MNNLSDIGFPIHSEEELVALAEAISNEGRSAVCDEGTYYIYEDLSGAQLFVQVNTRRQLIGLNPHFAGKSKRTVCLTNTVERPESVMDGAFHAWASPREPDSPGGDYPFVFDVPDYRLIGPIAFPKNWDIQLSAFARDDFAIFDTDQDFINSQTHKLKIASEAFIPSGLLFPAGQTTDPRAEGVFAGVIKDWAERQNHKTNTRFYWFLVDTLGGEVDVVADESLVKRAPRVGGILYGQFWLSGKLINPPIRPLTPKRKSIFNKLFG